MAKIDEVCGNVLIETLGDETARVISVISTPMEDKEISKKLDYDTAKVRTILNELLVRNLVHLDRFRHDTGYCNYRWVRRDDKIKAYVNEYLEERIREIDSRLSDVEEISFECECSRFDYGAAIEAGFSCPSCGERLEQAESGKGSRKMREELRKLNELRNAS